MAAEDETLTNATTARTSAAMAKVRRRANMFMLLGVVGEERVLGGLRRGGLAENWAGPGAGADQPPGTKRPERRHAGAD